MNFSQFKHKLNSWGDVKFWTSVLKFLCVYEGMNAVFNLVKP